MKLPLLPTKMSLRGKRVLVRVDWNVPLSKQHEPEDLTKIRSAAAVIHHLFKRGASVTVMSHLGRPKKPDPSVSLKHLLPAIERAVGIAPKLISEPGKLKPDAPRFLLLENVRFFKGEEDNATALAKAYAAMGDLFVNEAFASCHREHASVVGVTKYLPSYAGPSLVAEVAGLSRLIEKPSRPFVACIGGAKLTTKLDVITALLDVADRVLIGGAMAHPFFVAKGLSVGKSLIEKAGVKIAKKLLKHPKIVLPLDVVVAPSLKPSVARVVPITGVTSKDVIVDIGTDTMRMWAEEFKRAKTIVWNGPVGIAEIPTFVHGSLFTARAIASRSKGPCFGVVGGGDTLPIVEWSGMQEWIDHVSMGGGAMLEFIALKGKLPGLVALEKRKK